MAFVMRAIPQIDVELDPDAAPAAKKYRGAFRRKTGAVGRQKQIGVQFIAERFTDLAQIGRPDLFTCLDQEFGIEAEPAASRIANGAQGRQIDAMLALVVGRAAAVDTIADRCRLPRIEAVSPFALHAVDDIAMPVHQDGRS
jgi:hypothetical protein